MQLLTQMRFGDFLWFATIHLPITSCDVELAALTYGLGLLQGRERALVPGGRTDFSILYRWPQHHLSNESIALGSHLIPQSFQVLSVK